MKELRKINPGKKVTYGGMEWVILEQEAGRALCLAVGSIGNKAFDEDNRNNWTKSSLRDYLNGEFLENLIQNGADEEAILPTEFNLLSEDGLDDYGSSTDKIGLISCEQYRRFRRLVIPLRDWWWTITPWSTAANGYATYVRVVGSGGSLDYSYACSGAIGVRPLCTLDSSVLVSFEEV